MATCYRHPNRETGVSCSNCGRPICPDCMTPTSVGMRCPECARQRTKVRQMGGGRLGTAGEPTLTYILIGINVAVALGAFLSGAGATSGGVGASRLLEDGSVSRFTVGDGDYWRILTAGFLHVGLFHIAFNMLALYILGSMVEPAVGRLRFAIIYFVSLLAGSFGALLLEPTAPTVGASGAVFGLMGAGVVVLRKRGINVMESGLGIWLLLNLVITFSVSGISIGGHLGGLAGGAVAGLLLVELGDRVRIPPLVPNLLAAGIGVVAVAGSIAVSSSAV